MPPFLSPLRVAQPSLPAHCEPENDFLYHFSATFHTCVPTNLSFISSLLGTFSIVSWLFAQLPQIYKNHQLKSTSGLSIFFLAEWLLGDVSNLLGSLLTNQALWQVIIAGYYVSVDCALVGQWIWYELLKHGRPLRPAWSPLPSSDRKPDQRDPVAAQDVYEGLSVESVATAPASSGHSKPDADKKPPGSSGRNIPHRSNPMDTFRIPNFARSPSSTKEASSMGTAPTLGTTPNRTVRRLAASTSPMPSPKTILYISLILGLLTHSSTAKPLSPFAPAPYHTLHLTAATTSSSSSSSAPASEIAGKVLSWMSTFLYLGSRLPQLYKNYLRKSTAGLSPALFAAAFFGNLFYSTSLLTNPCAWHTYKPGEGAGWVGKEGSERSEWVLRATPFFLGAAGVLVMDAAVGFQFLYFGDGVVGEGRGRPTTRDEDLIVVLNDHGVRKWRRWRWRRVSGWMRGWVPSVSVAGTPNISRASTPAETPRSGSPSSSTRSGSSSRPNPTPNRAIGGSAGRGALDEARALLGTSPRSYGTSPRSPSGSPLR